jgi:RNA polymerase sigma-70 factor (ECF subfamily)
MSTLNFDQQLIEFQRSLKSFAYGFTNNEEDANDLLQETYLKALTYRDKFQEQTNLKAWLYTIMRNTFINNYRKAVRANTILDKTDEQFYINNTTSGTGFADPDSTYSHKQISKVVEDLEDEYKVPFQMYNTGFKYKEIAEKLDLPIGTIKSRIFLARKKLMLSLADYR